MFRKVTMITDTGLEKLFRKGFPVGTAYFQAYVRALMVVSHVVGKASSFPLGAHRTHENLGWLEKPTSNECMKFALALRDCTRVEAVIRLDKLEGVEVVQATISMCKGKACYGFVRVNIAVTEKGGQEDLAYATLGQHVFG